MSAAGKSAATLVALCLMLVLGGLWGWRALTAPLPQQEEQPLCSDVTVATGDEVTTEQVAVSVFNGTGRTGLASATLEQLVERGFIAADTGNAPKRTKSVEIWTDQPKNAAVRLVARQFKGSKVVSGEELGRGVNVVLGENFKKLHDKQVATVEALEDSTFCGVRNP